MNQKKPHAAADWWVQNNADRALDWESAARWEEWRRDPENRAEYVGLMQLQLDLLELPPPAPPSKRELLKDAPVRSVDSLVTESH